MSADRTARAQAGPVGRFGATDGFRRRLRENEADPDCCSSDLAGATVSSSACRVSACERLQRGAREVCVMLAVATDDCATKCVWTDGVPPFHTPMSKLSLDLHSSS